MSIKIYQFLCPLFCLASNFSSVGLFFFWNASFTRSLPVGLWAVYFLPLVYLFSVFHIFIEIEKFLITEVFLQLKRVIKFEYHHFAKPNQLINGCHYAKKDNWLLPVSSMPPTTDSVMKLCLNLIKFIISFQICREHKRQSNRRCSYF